MAAGPYLSVAVAVEGTVYTFGGRDYDAGNFDASNSMWKLSRTMERSFIWSFTEYQIREESPSPRCDTSGWEFAGKVWIFGGIGPSSEGYLNVHGDFAISQLDLGEMNNQLLCFDPNTQKWTNPQCYGDKPSPRYDHCTAIIREKVWLFGGFHLGGQGGFYQLAMDTLTWTQIHIGPLGPQGSCFSTLTATGNDQLVLYGFGEVNLNHECWVMDPASHSWRLHSEDDDTMLNFYTASKGLNNSVIMFGGCINLHDGCNLCNNILHVTFEPKSLQKLTLGIIYKHSTELPWKSLPKKLIALLGISRQKQDSRDVFLLSTFSSAYATRSRK